MELTTWTINGTTVVGVRGRLTGGLEQRETFHGFMRTVFGTGESDVVVNLSETTWANSQGIGMLIGAYTSARRVDGMVVLSHVNDRIQCVLDVTRLCLLLQSFVTDEDAAKYLRERSGELLLA